MATHSQGHTSPTTGEKIRRVVSAGSVTGDSVRNLSGDDLGNIQEIMLDVNDGSIAYAVLSFGGFLGMGDKLFAVPWQALTLVQDEEHFLLDVDKKKLENAPGFDKDNWPDFSDPSWGQGIHDHYGTTPYWQRGGQQGQGQQGAGGTARRGV
ncbi:MAG: PRC-barrel domain containing protein [Gemmatimonadales bacterium]|nr:MAG: PRC-barrel domain containing protein [Gemmatimonadales bacterium]